MKMKWQDAGWKRKHLVREDGKIVGSVDGSTYEWNANLRADVPPYPSLGQFTDEAPATRAVERALATQETSK